MQKTLDFFNSELAQIRTGRATPALLENVKVKVYDGAQELKISEIGTITVQDTKTLLIQPFDTSIIGEIKKGIEKANIGLRPAIDGQLIRIVLPPLSDERRREYVKILKQKAEAARIAIRNIRRDFIEDLEQAEKNKEISEDDKFRLQDNIQKLTDEFNKKIADSAKAKEKELMQV
jgi:ribosome recycling factor